MSGHRLEGDLFTECASWIWDQIQEEGGFVSGELIELIMNTERELEIQGRPIPEIARVVDEEFRMRGITGNPFPIDVGTIRTVLEWETDFLGYAGIPRAESAVASAAGPQ